jgi:uncharacterized membrane protein
MTVLKIALIALGIAIVCIGAAVWYVIGQFVVGYAKMEADERVAESAPTQKTSSENHAD